MTMSPRALGQDLLNAKLATAPRRNMMLRRFSVSTLNPDGNERIAEYMAPATPEFENAFNAFARGTVLATTQGPCAIEDLRPGMQLLTAENGAQTVTWIGSITLVPNFAGSTPEQTRMTRVTADRFGPAQPAASLMVGPGARLLHQPDVLRGETVRGQAYTPFAEFIDDESVIPVTPPAPVQMFHVCTEQHSTIYADGVAVETFHPGYHLQDSMGPNKLALFLSLFPQVKELSDFGLLAHPRMSLRALTSLDAA